MKSMLNKLKYNTLFGIIIGIILCSGIVYGSNVYQSNTIEYSPTDSSWEVRNVNEAINSLYSMKTELDNIKNIGDATAANILKGKKAVVKGSTVTGTMKNMSGNWIWTSNGIEEYTYTSGSKANMVYVRSRDDSGDGYITTNSKFIVGQENEIKKNLLAGKTLLGVTGTATSDATATAADIASGKTAYVNGTKITGNGANTTININDHTETSVTLEEDKSIIIVYARYAQSHWTTSNTITYPTISIEGEYDKEISFKDYDSWWIDENDYYRKNGMIVKAFTNVKAGTKINVTGSTSSHILY